MSVTDLTHDGRRPLYRHEFESLAYAGAFGDERIELLDGQLYYASEESPLHADVHARLNRLLVESIPEDEGMVRAANPFTLSALSMPQPDFLVAAPGQDYRIGHPRRASLIIEVSKSSRARDLGLKARLYADGGVPDYWVVDLVREVVVVHRDPAPGTFRSVTTHADGPVQALNHPGLVLDARALLR